MGTLYVDRKHTRLSREGKALIVSENGRRHSTVPVGLLDRIVLVGSVELDSGLLAFLAAEGVSVVVLGGRFHQNLATVTGEPGNEVRRRAAQYRLFADPDWRLEWSGRIVRHKLASQQRLLQRAMVARPDRRHQLFEAAGTISSVRAQVASIPVGSHAMDRLRGLEGAGAAAYFRGYRTLFPESLEFDGRNRRPPRDPVNAVLSLGYTLLHADAVKACYAAGLDPLLGYLHEPEHGRASLAADLVEPFRPKVDRLAWDLFRDRAIGPSHFWRQGGACLLDKAGRATFYPAYETAAGSWRRALRRMTTGLAVRLPAIAAARSG